ncbi:Gfo/Idh/MocA family oxidoreductase [Mariniflexile litorale]|uniref:Gfo/Idh/MocA family oxidoreductase n=1 Tax=Mariniflexile litorale TaxID=3045158 RepID=A0AAU7ECC4_9FLAO|nr:Gfo/Idh/MocA family oxidoreductase [Mariniflexile sp. KMM 9835]MDQ8210578.1 Gfo/Idh/MocA family oxidoreductase [Mariniflexile sp. KMM 9835]
MQPINTALCSYGMSGHVFHAPFISVNPQFNLYGVFERTKNEAQQHYPSIKTFRSLDDMLADDNIELVVVNTPNITHFDFSKKAINAGKHLVIEKPFTVTVAEAEALIQLAKEKNVLISVYHNRRYDSDFKTVQKVLNEGLLGDIVEAEFHYDRFDPALSYKTHKETPTEGVGSLYDLGSHLIDQALQLFGIPKSINADLDSFRPNSKVGDYFDVKLFYPSHRVILKSSYYVREPLPGNILHGTKGSFIKTKADVQEKELQADKKPNTVNWGIEPDSEKGLLHTEKDGKIIKEHIPTLQGNYMEYYNGIYEAIRNNKSVPVSAEDGTLVIKIIEAAVKSNKEKRIIEL